MPQGVTAALPSSTTLGSAPGDHDRTCADKKLCEPCPVCYRDITYTRGEAADIPRGGQWRICYCSSVTGQECTRYPEFTALVGQAGEQINGIYEADYRDFNRETYARGRETFDRTYAAFKSLLLGIWRREEKAQEDAGVA